MAQVENLNERWLPFLEVVEPANHKKNMKIYAVVLLVGVALVCFLNLVKSTPFESL